MSEVCPCGSGIPYATCCGPFHAGAEAPTALQLMRSRYAAFVRTDAAYLVRTAHPVERTKLDVRSLRASFAVTWLGLEIVACSGGTEDDHEGMVHFRARFRSPDGRERMVEERSRFVRAGGAWVYTDGRG